LESGHLGLPSRLMGCDARVDPVDRFTWIRPGWVSVANVREKQDWSKSECILTTSAKENFRQQLLGLEVPL
jgi:hypothetical protein